nr:MAG TPA: holin family protein [Caudoviricetes sp.]
MNELLNLDIAQISYGALFVWLLFDTNKKNEAREKKYQDIIDNLSVNIGVINDVKEDVEEIKDIISRGVSNE